MRPTRRMTPLPVLLSPVRGVRDLASVPVPSAPAAGPREGRQESATQVTSDLPQAALGGQCPPNEEER